MDNNPVPVPAAVSRFMSQIGRRGGTARAKALSKRELSQQAKHAAAFRWKRKKRAASA
jgi:hypothetical protein